MNYIRRGFRKSSYYIHTADRQTNRQTDATKSITTPVRVW